MKFVALAFLALAACGGGGSVVGNDAVVEITYAQPGPGRSGECEWSDRGVFIRIDPYYESEFYEAYRDAILRHELWHAMTRLTTHSDDPACISSTPAPGNLWQPCADERVEVLSSDYAPVKARFPQDPAALERAAAWWNEWCGKTVVVVVP